MASSGQKSFEKVCLEAHNKYRALHGVPPLKINPKLTAEAQKWAEIFLERNKFDNIDDQYGHLMYMAVNKVIDGADVVKQWYDQIEFYDFKRGEFIQKAAYFTQLIWRNTSELGVGIATKDANTYVVVYYNPSGNIRGQYKDNVLRKLSDPERVEPRSPQTDSEFELACLEAHNKYRSLHGVPPLKINPQLTEKARRWAQTCLERNELKISDEDYGQLVVSWDGKVVFGEDLVKSWYDQIEFYDFQRAKYSRQAANFTQVIWRDTTELGIGIAKRGLAVYIIAYYYPTGNVEGFFKENVLRKLTDPNRIETKPLSQKEFEQQCVKAMNKYRALHGVVPLKINPKLTEMALERAKTYCDLGTIEAHTDLRYGEIAASGGKINAEEKIKSWYDEIELYDFDTAETSGSGSFAQIIWKDTTEVGVAFAIKNYKTYMVAKFYVVGNIRAAYEENILRKLTDPKRADKKVAQPKRPQTQKEFEQDCLKTHNDYRALHGVPPLKINPVLTKHALEWAKELRNRQMFEHAKQTGEGENLYKSNQPVVQGKDATKAWYDEILLYDYDNPGFSLETGHFTQLIWHDTTDMGAAYAYGDLDFTTYVVTRYTKPGNNVSEIAEQAPRLLTDPKYVAPRKKQTAKDLEKAILEAHNKYRAVHGVPPLVIGPKIDEHAKKWAQVCRDRKKVDLSQDSTYGELIIAGEKIFGEDLVKSYYDEIEFYNFDRAELCEKASKFTQIVWKDTTELGIGVAEGDKMYVVINYNTPGNIRGQFKENVLRKLGDPKRVEVKPHKLEKDFEQAVLKAHNKYRALHGVPPLKISAQLNDHAKMWAQICLDSGQVETSKQGQNIVTGSFTGIDGEQLVDSWYNQIEFYDFDRAEHSPKSEYFTQLIWKDTTELGVGLARRGPSTCAVIEYNKPGNVRQLFRENVLRKVSDRKPVPQPPIPSPKALAPQVPVSPKQFKGKSFEQVCLEAHNRYRELHGVPPLTINPTLTQHAKKWAQVCLDRNKMEHSKGTNYGENIYHAEGKPVDGDMPAKAWYDEIAFYNFDRAEFSPKTGHFTQLIWRDTSEVGVGIAMMGPNTYVVANYSKAGNIIGHFKENVPRKLGYQKENQPKPTPLKLPLEQPGSPKKPIERKPTDPKLIQPKPVPRIPVLPTQSPQKPKALERMPKKPQMAVVIPEKIPVQTRVTIRTGTAHSPSKQTQHAYPKQGPGKGTVPVNVQMNIHNVPLSPKKSTVPPRMQSPAKQKQGQEAKQGTVLQALFGGEGNMQPDQTLQQKPPQSSSLQRAPIQPKPIQQKPIQQVPIQQKLIQQKPIQQVPIQQKPIQQKPIQQVPIQQKPIQQKPIQQKPIQQKPIQQKPFQQKPTQTTAPQRNSVQKKPMSPQKKLVHQKPTQPTSPHRSSLHKRPSHPTSPQKPQHQPKPILHKPSQQRPVQSNLQHTKATSMKPQVRFRPLQQPPAHQKDAVRPRSAQGMPVQPKPPPPVRPVQVNLQKTISAPPKSMQPPQPPQREAAQGQAAPPKPTQPAQLNKEQSGQEKSAPARPVPTRTDATKPTKYKTNPVKSKPKQVAISNVKPAAMMCKIIRRPPEKPPTQYPTQAGLPGRAESESQKPRGSISVARSPQIKPHQARPSRIQVRPAQAQAQPQPQPHKKSQPIKSNQAQPSKTQRGSVGAAKAGPTKPYPAKAGRIQVRSQPSELKRSRPASNAAQSVRKSRGSIGPASPNPLKSYQGKVGRIQVKAVHVPQSPARKNVGRANLANARRKSRGSVGQAKPKQAPPGPYGKIRVVEHNASKF